MIEDLTNIAIASLLTASVPGLAVHVGVSDDELATPCAVVSSEIDSMIESRNPFYKLLVKIEYISVSNKDTAANDVTTLTAIDDAITNQPPPEIMSQVQTAGLGFLAWFATPKSQNIAGDRRSNIRELNVTAQPLD